MLVVMRDHWPVLLNAWEPYLVSCWLHLYQAPVDLADDLTRDDFPEADFTGYQPVQLQSWLPAYLNVDQIGQKDHEVVLWIKGVGGMPNEIWGYFITDYLEYVVAAEDDYRGPQYVSVDGQPYAVRPSVTLENVFGILPEPTRSRHVAIKR